MKGFKRLSQAALLFATIGVSAQAMAVMSAPNGWYLEGNVGSSHQNGKTYGSAASTGNSGMGGSGNLGYKFMPYIAAEADYTLYSRTSVKDSTSTLAAKDRIYSYGLAARGIFPVSDTGIELFARLGAAQVRSKLTIKNATAASNIGVGNSSHSHIGLYWGGGASWYFMPELAVNAQYARVEGNSATGDMSLLSGGITFIFG